MLTGITGQDGSYLAEQLLSRNYEVHGLVRRTSSTQRVRLDTLFHDSDVYDKRLFLHYADLDDTTTIRRILLKTEPDELADNAGTADELRILATPVAILSVFPAESKVTF